MELRQLEFVVALAAELDLDRAAERVGVEPAELGRLVADLELELATSLFDQSGPAVVLTGAGARFLDEAQAVLAAVRRARDSVATDGQARLYVGTSNGLADRQPGLAARLAEATPPVRAEFVSGSTQTRLDGVRSGRLDAALIRGGVAAPDLDVLPAWSDELVAVLPATNPISEQSTASIFDLLDLPLCLVPRALNPPLVELLEQTCRRLGFEPERARPSTALEQSLDTVAAATPAWTVLYAGQAEAVDSAQLAVRPFDPPLLMPTSLVVAPGTASAAVAALVAASAELATG